MSKLQGYEVTGEFRLPKHGEWLIEPESGRPEQASGDWRNEEQNNRDPLGYGWRRVILRRVEPAMVALIVPRDVAEWYATRPTYDPPPRQIAVIDAARAALAREGIVIAGPGGSETVSAEAAHQLAAFFEDDRDEDYTLHAEAAKALRTALGEA